MAKILVMDDDPTIVKVVRFLLEKEKHSVIVARDGKLGLELARTEHPDLILLDVMMPEMDGFSVSGELFKDKSLRSIPVLVLTAKDHSRDIFSLVPNVVSYMNKPFDPQDFVTAVQELLPSSEHRKAV